MNLYDDLMWRGLIKDTAGEDLEKKLNEGGVTFYWGTDPTADSLHIGHYSSLVTVKRLLKAGHKPILLVGGATGMIGDPRPSAEREIMQVETLQKNLEGIKKQVTKLFGEQVEVVNNYDWTKGFGYLEFLRDVGKYININYMINKDIIRRRLETGITYAEFSYTLLQGYDFLHLFETKNCIMQVEGSDQWGNITTGIDLIRKKLDKEAYAFTMPLVLDPTGKKFGKSEGNALWLDLNRTSGYELYQYLINSADSKVEEYLKVFTFLSKEEIEDIVKQHNEKPELRLAQKTLAYEVVKDIHGKEEAEKAIKTSESLFTGDITEVSLHDLEIIFKNAPSFKIEQEEDIISFLVNNKICSSKREAREFVTAGSILVNGKKIQEQEYVISRETAIESKLVIVRRGKKKYFIGRFA